MLTVEFFKPLLDWFAKKPSHSPVKQDIPELITGKRFSSWKHLYSKTSGEVETKAIKKWRLGLKKNQGKATALQDFRRGLKFNGTPFLELIPSNNEDKVKDYLSSLITTNLVLTAEEQALLEFLSDVGGQKIIEFIETELTEHLSCGLQKLEIYLSDWSINIKKDSTTNLFSYDLQLNLKAVKVGENLYLTGLNTTTYEFELFNYGNINNNIIDVLSQPNKIAQLNTMLSSHATVVLEACELGRNKFEIYPKITKFELTCYTKDLAYDLRRTPSIQVTEIGDHTYDYLKTRLGTTSVPESIQVKDVIEDIDFFMANSPKSSANLTVISPSEELKESKKEVEEDPFVLTDEDLKFCERNTFHPKY